jgi:cyclopropane-fatty-acyl-phospholipid synthase
VLLAAKNYMLTALKQAVKVGYLQIEEAGTVHQFGFLKEGGNQVYITVLNDSFWTRMFLWGLGLHHHSGIVTNFSCTI